MNNCSKTLTIFEGCDGSGKTTAAKEFAAQTGARYVHFPALPRVKHRLARMYVEAMLPAVLGYQDVVFDRSWLSETPYGEAFREGRDRLTKADRRMLERLALRCGAVMVLCQPSWDTVRDNYRRRKGQEMLRNERQLREVYDLYKMHWTHLPWLPYDFENDSLECVWSTVNLRRTPRHPTKFSSAGNWDARIVIVGESFDERKDHDSWYQWPFASFSGEGCSQWLTNQLEYVRREGELLWVNADQDLTFLGNHQGLDFDIYALGTEAERELFNLKIHHTRVSHPQHHKRFHSNQIYELIKLITPIKPE
jgi:thymidylate kinase